MAPVDLALVAVVVSAAVVWGAWSFWLGYRKAMRDVEGKTRQAVQVKLSEIRVERNEANGDPGV